MYKEETKITDIKTNNENIGQIQIADEVIATIAGTAALEVDGVSEMSGNITEDLVGMFGKKNLSKGVKVTVDGRNVSAAINIGVKLGYKIPEISAMVQERVKSAVETMTGLSVAEVNVFISGITQEKDKLGS